MERFAVMTISTGGGSEKNRWFNSTFRSVKLSKTAHIVSDIVKFKPK